MLDSMLVLRIERKEIQFLMLQSSLTSLGDKLQHMDEFWNHMCIKCEECTEDGQVFAGSLGSLLDR